MGARGSRGGRGRAPWCPGVRTLRVYCRGCRLGPCLGHQDPECHVVWPKIEGKKKKKVGTRREETGREGRVPRRLWAGRQSFPRQGTWSQG